MTNFFLPCNNYYVEIDETKIKLKNIDLYTGDKFNYCKLEDGRIVKYSNME